MSDLKHLKRFPTTAYLRAAARRSVPHFAFEFGDGGAGEDAGIARNWSALADIAVVPRYGVAADPPSLDVDLFGTRYAAPLGIAPIGGAGAVWPGADLALARAAQAARVPYTLSTAANATIEAIAGAAPDVFWFQLYRFPNNDHAIGFDLVDRVRAAGAKVLALTLDVPVRTTRSREARAGLGGVFRLTPAMMWSVVTHPRWLGALMREGVPGFGVLERYAGGSRPEDAIAFMSRESRGTFSWEELKRYRERWPGPMVVKGIQHPADAEEAVRVGVDAVWVSNHGGRQVEALAASVDTLPGVVAAAGGKARVLFDGGLRAGQDIMRALALGADAAFAGKSFLWALAALGGEGPEFLIALYRQELQAALAQIGAVSLVDARRAHVIHPGAIAY